MITPGLVFWVLMLLWLIFGWWRYPPYVSPNYAPFGGHILLWVVLLCLGVRVFGNPFAGW